MATQLFNLPQIAPDQAQKHLPVNWSLDLIDVALGRVVRSATTATPPSSPGQGWAYIVPPGATFGTVGAGSVAVWNAGAWHGFDVPVGGRFYVTDAGADFVRGGEGWTEAGASSAVPFLGIGGATADDYNRLSVYGQAALFNSGSGFEVTVNKATPAADASFAFKTGFSARAIFGLLGSDDFTIKTSPDGSTFADALVAAGDGSIRLPGGLMADVLLRDLAAPTKAARFDLAGITAGQTRVFTLPNESSTLAILSGTQTFTGAKTFSGTFNVSATTATLGSSTAASTIGVGTGATVSGASKTVNIGTGGASGSTTTVNIGPAASGAASIVNINSAVVLQGLPVDPPAPVDGSVWHNSVTGQIRAVSGGGVRVIGGAAVPFVMPAAGSYLRTDNGAGTTAATVAGAANRFDVFPWVCRQDVTIDRLGINCTTAVAGALAKIAVFAADANGRPAGRLTETGDLDLSTTGAKEATLSLSLLEGEVYWFGVRHSATATVSAWQPYTTPNIPLTTLSTAAGGVYRRTLAFATGAPANWGWLATEAATGNAPAVWLRVA